MKVKRREKVIRNEKYCEGQEKNDGEIEGERKKERKSLNRFSFVRQSGVYSREKLQKVQENERTAMR